MRHDEIHVILGKGLAVASDACLISQSIAMRRALHLHAPKALPLIHHKVIPFAVSPRLANRDPDPASLGEKRCLHSFPAPFIVIVSDRV